MKATRIPEKSRVIVQGREQMRCALCGTPAMDGHWHHRRSRSVRDELTHSPINGVWVHPGCHDWIHANPFESRGLGFIVSRFSNPGTEPLKHSMAGWILLYEDGSWQSVADPGRGVRVE